MYRLGTFFVIAVATYTLLFQSSLNAAYESFEGGTVPSAWVVNPSEGSLGLTTDVYKHGAQAMHWNWTSAGSTLTYSTDDLDEFVAGGEPNTYV